MGLFNKSNDDVIVMALHDSAANAFAMPMFFASAGLAIRALADAVNGGDKNISAHSTDFKLFKIGTYNPVSGVLTAVGPELVISAAELVQK